MTGQAQREPDRRPALRDVVVEIAEQLLEARIEVGRRRDQEQVEVDLVETEALRQLLERRSVERAQRTGIQPRRRALLRDPHRVLVGHHQPA